MTGTRYNVYIVIDGNPANLNQKNLAPWGEIDFHKQAVVGQQVTVSYTRDKDLLAKVFFRVIRIVETKGLDNLIMIETGREDY